MVGTLLETGVGIAAALGMAAGMPVVGHARDHGLATTGLLEHDLLREELVVEDGRMWLPDRPGPGGLGIEVDDEAVPATAPRRLRRSLERAHHLG